MIKRWSNQTPLDESFPKVCDLGRSQLCAGGEKGRGACQGDSGSALVVCVSKWSYLLWNGNRGNLGLAGKETIPGTNEERWSMGLARYHQLEQRLCARRWVNSKWSVEREDVVRFMIQVDLLIIVQSLCFEFDLLMIGPSPLVAGHPTVFTEVAKYKDWIAQQYGMAIP